MGMQIERQSSSPPSERLTSQRHNMVSKSLLKEDQMSCFVVPLHKGRGKNSRGLQCQYFHQEFLMTVIKDPIHGSIQLHPLLMKIINTPAFNRLKYIRQLGGVYYVYPGATHSRFEHSIGVCYLAGEYARTLKRTQPHLGISEGDILNIEIAGLCHDLGHGPFSHLFDSKVLNKLITLQEEEELSHEDLSVMVLKHIYSSLKGEFDEVKKRREYEDLDVSVIEEMINPKPDDIHRAYEDNNPRGKRMFLYEIVANKSTDIDVDKWDYFIRDCHYMGLTCEFDYKRLMQLSRVNNVAWKFTDSKKTSKTEALRICYSRKEADNILGMFRTRASLFQKAYRHKTVIAVEHQLSSAILAVKDLPLICPAEEKPGKIIKRSIAQICGDLIEERKVIDYLSLTDGIIGQIVNMVPDGVGEDEKLTYAKKQIRDLSERELPCRVSLESVQDLVKCVSQNVKEKLKGKSFEEAKKKFCKLQTTAPASYDNTIEFVTSKLLDRKEKEKMEDPEFPQDDFLEQIEEDLATMVEDYFVSLLKPFAEQDIWNDLFFEKVKISYVSGKKCVKGPLLNPKLLFFSKDNPSSAKSLTDEEVNPLFAPKKYTTITVWVYCPKGKRSLISSALTEMVKKHGQKPRDT